MAGAAQDPTDHADKLRFDLIPPYTLERLAEVYTVGSIKYGDNDYLAGMDWHRVIGAMMRHLNQFRDGESIDPDGFHHLAAVMWGAATLMMYEKYELGKDDRELVPDRGDRIVPAGSVTEMAPGKIHSHITSPYS